MKITVILCTHNRCKSLANALSSAAASVVPENLAWDVLVVDNNSSDETFAVVDGFRRRYPDRFSYVFEPQPGKSYALNTGIREARGEILAFMDDDVTVEPTWLRNLTHCLESEDSAGAGGRILPEWTSTPPAWLPHQGHYPLAPLVCFDFGDEAGPLFDPPFGTNMAFKRFVFEKYGGFRTDLGPNPANMIRGEDTEFGARLLAAGERLRYEPSAVVYHPVTEDRVRKAYFLGWWFAKARADVRQNGIDTHRIRCGGVPLVFIRRLAIWTLRWLVIAQPRMRFEAKINVWTNAGLIVECYRRNRGRQPAITRTHIQELPQPAANPAHPAKPAPLLSPTKPPS